MNTNFFQDLLVVELASVLAGPAVGMFFAELGARVIKIENKKSGGDVTRSWKLPGEDPNSPVSAYYHSVNWGKEVYFLDLTEAADKDQALTWVAQADILISNFRPSAARKMGLDADSLRARFPNLIYAQITGYGGDSDLPAFDMVLQAEAGFMYMTGEAGRAPVRMPVALIDVLAAHQLKEGILIALLRKAKTGQGAIVQVALRDAAVASLANQASNWLVAGHIPGRMGSLHPNIAPYGDIFTTKDGQLLVLAVGNDAQFAALGQSLGIPSMIADPRFKRNELRVKNREALSEVLSTAIGKRQQQELTTIFWQQGVPFGRIRNLQEVFADPVIAGLILSDAGDQPYAGKRVRTAIFEVKWD